MAARAFRYFRRGPVHVKKVHKIPTLEADVVQAVLDYRDAVRALGELGRRHRARTPVEREELRDALAAAIQRKSAALAALDGVLVGEE